MSALEILRKWDQVFLFSVYWNHDPVFHARHDRTWREAQEVGGIRTRCGLLIFKWYEDRGFEPTTADELPAIHAQEFARPCQRCFPHGVQVGPLESW